MTKDQLQTLLTALEQRFGVVRGDEAEANTVATYTDGVLDCLRFIVGMPQLRDPQSFRYIMSAPPSEDLNDKTVRS